MPSEEVVFDTTPIVGDPVKEDMWRHVDWREVGRRTAIVIVVGGVVLITVGSGGTAGAVAAPAARLIPALVGA